MCGIAGIISPTGKPARLMAAMADIIRHRGPDDEGFLLFNEAESDAVVCGGADTAKATWNSGSRHAPTIDIRACAGTAFRYALGHRRLSIVDLSPLGHQPMCSADQRYWIVFNGEIYNHIELREELENLGHRFFSHSDTEVILASYSEWGPACQARFNGMWAFAILDTVEQTLFLSRDRFGVKPLYYWLSSDGSINFASEIKQFSVLPGWQARLNRQRTYDFLAFGLSDHTDETMFAGVYQLPPGHFVSISYAQYALSKLPPGSRLPVMRWYSLSAGVFSGSFEEACTEFRKHFENSIALRLRADVDIGSCLSGGLDSSSIVCVMNRQLAQKNAAKFQKTFSACAEVEEFNERKWIDIVVDATGVDAHFVYPSLSCLFAESPSITWHQDEPFGSTSIYAQWCVFRLASENGVKVMLDGQGSDEQLAGYHGYFGPRLATLLRQSRYIELTRELSAMRRLHGYGLSVAAKHLATYIFSDSLIQALRRLGKYTNATPEWIDLTRLDVTPKNPFLASGARRGSIRALSESQLTASNLQMLLHWEDRDSMAHSIESRVPFLDYRLVEFVLGLPDDFKLSLGVTKRVLRGAMDGCLPEPIRQRIDKLGFATPEEVWLRQDAPDLFRARINEAISLSAGMLRGPDTRRILEEMISGKRQFSFLPWRIISFGEWIKAFSVVL